MNDNTIDAKPISNIYHELHGYYFEDLSVGLSAVFTKTISEADLVLFAGVSGDTNPLHLDEEFASNSRFGARIAHGMLSASIISAVLGTKLPGPGCVYLSQDLKFLAPVKIGESICARVTVEELSPGSQRVTLSTICTVAGRTVVKGSALMYVEPRP